MGSMKMAAQPPPYGTANAPPPQQGYFPPPQQGYAPPPDQGYAPPPPYAPSPQQAGAPPQQPVVVVQHVQSPIVGQIRLNQYPATMTCPYCQQNITTTTESSVGCFAWLIGGALCFFGCFPCACIPCCVDDCMDFTHSCPSYKRMIGTYKRL